MNAVNTFSRSGEIMEEEKTNVHLFNYIENLLEDASYDDEVGSLLL